jgi:hypothetical protein
MYSETVPSEKDLELVVTEAGLGEFQNEQMQAGAELEDLRNP